MFSRRLGGLVLAGALVLAWSAAALGYYHGGGSGGGGSGGGSSGGVSQQPAAAPAVKGSFRIGTATVQLAGKEVTLEVPPHIFRGGSAWVPVRAVAEAWGARVDWDAAARAVHVFGPKGEHFFAKVGESRATVLAGGGQPEFTAPVHIVKDRVQVPLRFLAEHFGYKVAWDEATRTVTVSE